MSDRISDFDLLEEQEPYLPEDEDEAKLTSASGWLIFNRAI